MDTVAVPGTSGAAGADRGLRCPNCQYNLTGLTQPRCPECGTVFDWAAVERAAANPPQIAFERARGWGKVPAFFVTWATVLFAPWVFARQIVRRGSLPHALAFAAVCFAGSGTSMLFGAGFALLTTWLVTAAAYIPIQTLFLSALDFTSWRAPLRSLRFWLLVGCYTSAIMLTELEAAPPLAAQDLWQFLWEGHEPPGKWVVTGEPYECSRGALIWWSQMLLWLAGLGACYYRRLRQAGHQRRWVLPATAVAVVALLWLYSAAVGYIGVWVAGKVWHW